MKKRLLTMLLAGMLAAMNLCSALAAEINGTVQEETSAEEASQEAVSEETEESTAEEETAQTKIVIPQGNMVNVDKIDLSLHAETSGEFSPVYAYENPFNGKDTSKGVILEFYAKPTWEVHELGAIFAFNGSGEYDGKLYFSPGSYLGFNSDLFGGYFDANLFNYTIVTDYIKDGASIRIEILPEGFSVYADDVLCYDQTILDNPNAGGGDFTSESDFSGILAWLSGAEALYFGYGSWWNSVGTNEANIDLSEVSFRLMDGTVVMDQLKADKDLVESLGGSVDSSGSSSEAADIITEGSSVEIEIFDINSVEYEGTSVLPVMAAAVIAVAVIAVCLMGYSLKKRDYEET